MKYLRYAIGLLVTLTGVFFLVHDAVLQPGIQTGVSWLAGLWIALGLLIGWGRQIVASVEKLLEEP